MGHPVAVLYHADCLDGFGAAYAAWRRHGNAATYRPMHHGEPWNMNEVAGHDVFILDFSFPPALLESMAGIARSVTQIDHHASALKEWAGLARQDGEAFRYRHPTLPLNIHFNLDKSGARLAWEHFHPDAPPPLAIRHIEDQDMWRFALPDTRPFCRALRLMPFDLETWHALIIATGDESTARYVETVKSGTAIETFFQREVDRLGQGSLCRPARLRGEPVDALQAVRHGQAIVTSGGQSWLAVNGLAVNANALFASELGNLLAERGASFGLVWQLSGDGEIKASLRAKGSAPDVSVIAARYGGGGHPNAAGFRLPAGQFFSEVLNIES
ncbi:DHHA1 domain-containing protein [uncultured Dechloromonas sp.]|uniref:DHH family phosphoesterase n=1 Tax=uncultured Dechloromonas sp. TaxID=171719 RepID=UPI0025CCC715|nr:DHHA1 domain-containing protein [uncultured Dechloromonas sp.]